MLKISRILASNLYYNSARFSTYRPLNCAHFLERYLQDGVIQPPQFFNFASDVVDEWARLESVGRRPSRFPALWYVSDSGKELKWSFKDVSEMSMKTANVLQKECCQERNDKIMVVLPKTPEWWLVKLAASRIGACFSPGTSQLSTKDLEYRLSQYEATCVITDIKTAIKIDEISTRIPSLRSKVLVDPTMSIERNGWINLNQRLLKVNPRHECAQTRSDETFCVFFTSGTTGQPKMVAHTHSLGVGLLLDSKYFFEAKPDELIWCISDLGWIKSPYVAFYCAWIGGGERIDVQLLEEWEKRTNIQIRIRYGQTEMLTLCNQRRDSEYIPGSMGKPFPGIHLVVIDEDLNESHSKKITIFRGDRGYVDEEGYFWFVGRNDDVISSAGYRIGPSEVEEAINTHPAVAESAVVSSPDPERGEVVKAFVILRPEYKEQPQDLVKQLQDHVKSLTAPYKYPRKVEFVDSLPKTISGKVQRSALRKMEWKDLKILAAISQARKICVANNFYKWMPSRSNAVHFLDKYYDSEGILRAPKYFNFAHDVVDRWAKQEQAGERDSHLPALWFVKQDGKETKLNFSEISDMSKRAANFLEKECQLGRGDRIILILPLILEWWLLKLGASRIGAIVSSATVQLSPKDIEYRGTQLEATCIVADEKNVPKVDQVTSNIPTLKCKILADPTSSVNLSGWKNFNRLNFKYDSNHECALTKSDDSFAIFFTSGTTGNPKMVEHTHASLGLGLLNDSKYYIESKPGKLLWCISDPGATSTRTAISGFVSRNDDVISSAGYRIGPSEVEEAINTHPAVAESAVVSSPDPERGEVVKAFVILRPEYKEQPQDLVKQLQDHVRSLTAPYKYPRKVEFVDSLPKTISGKVQRSVLREMERENK
ncbi:ACSM3 [Cordylochernes scorpioides]|uniref:medium-chain acyl-CoA ligase n=1 Tax=Cordylochernes scorpioides TaxID=51811 RepID=A0ABY6K000_9ARAC|nr:ACSM3 [Cordylochernes scorpioides]